MTRQIILDTETTGIGHEQGHKIIEIGCIELIDRKLTGKHYHKYINPQREIDKEAFRVHGISNEFLQDKPLFADIVDEFLSFIQGAELIIHNAPFDVGFLNAELKRLTGNKKIEEYCTVFDTLLFARQKHPGQRASLDALCKRYAIDNSNRQLHGALLDAEILAYVYLAMTGGQSCLFAKAETTADNLNNENLQITPLSLANPVTLYANEDELSQHEKFITFLTEKSGINLWD